MKYEEMIPFALKGVKVRRHSGALWLELLEDGSWTTYNDQNDGGFMMTRETMLLDTWEVKSKGQVVWVSGEYSTMCEPNSASSLTWIKYRLQEVD